MDDREREDTMDSLNQTNKWVIWKTKDKWSTSLQSVGFHQLLHIHQDTQDEWWGFKIKGWCRTGDIRVKKPKKTFECWARNRSEVTVGAPESITTAQESITTVLLVPNHNFGKDEYEVDLAGHEA